MNRKTRIDCGRYRPHFSAPQLSADGVWYITIESREEPRMYPDCPYTRDPYDDSYGEQKTGSFWGGIAFAVFVLILIVFLLSKLPSVPSTKSIVYDSAYDPADNIACEEYELEHPSSDAELW